jgi:hypothetical protein
LARIIMASLWPESLHVFIEYILNVSNKPTWLTTKHTFFSGPFISTCISSLELDSGLTVTARSTNSSDSKKGKDKFSSGTCNESSWNLTRPTWTTCATRTYTWPAFLCSDFFSWIRCT